MLSYLAFKEHFYDIDERFADYGDKDEFLFEDFERVLFVDHQDLMQT